MQDIPMLLNIIKKKLNKKSIIKKQKKSELLLKINWDNKTLKK